MKIIERNITNDELLKFVIKHQKEIIPKVIDWLATERSEHRDGRFFDIDKVKNQLLNFNTIKLKFDKDFKKYYVKIRSKNYVIYLSVEKSQYHPDRYITIRNNKMKIYYFFTN